MTRAITAPELALLRLDKQRTRLYLALPAAPVVFAARVNQVFTSATRDMCVQVTFDGVTTGAYTDVIPGMSVLFGSTAGGWDRGIARARLAATSTLLKISESSDANLDDDLYISVVREFSPWAVQPRVLANTIKMDWNVAYSDQHTKFSPFPIWGSDRVAKLPVGGTVTLVFAAGASHCPGSSITGYSFSAPGASATSGLTTATPSVTYNAAGTYIIYLTVTAANLKTTLSSRIVYVWSDAAPPLEVEFGQLGCSLDAGGWTSDITLRDGCDESAVRPHAKAILFSEDWYGATAGSLGPLAGCENVVMSGWIADEGLDIRPNSSSARFTLAGANYWLGRESLYPVNVKNVTGTPAKWDEIKNLTFDQCAATILQNRTTLPKIVDCYLSGDTRRASRFEIGEGSAWEQLSSLAQSKILALPFCDRYSRLYLNVDAQYAPDKSVLPVVMDITKADRAANLNFGRQSVTSTALLQLSGIVYSGSTAKTLYSIAPGHTPKRHGVWASLDEILVSTQAELNALAGDLCGTQNNEFPSIPIDFEQGNRFIDCAPAQVCSLAIPAEDNIRGIAFSGNVIPRSIEYRMAGGVLRSSVDFEAVCAREMNRKGDIPTSDDGDTTPVPEIPPPFLPPPALPDFPPFPGVLGAIPVRALFVKIGTGVICCENINDAGAKVWQSLNGSLTAAESAAIIRIGVHRSGNYIYAVSPAYLLQAWFVELATSQFGLSIVMETTDLINILPPIAPNGFAINYRFSTIGVHPYSGEGIFVAGGGPLFAEEYYIFHISTSLVVTFGVVLNGLPTGNISWGDAEALIGKANGFYATSDFGATWTFITIRATSGFVFGTARAGLSPILGVYADEAYGKTQASTDNATTVTDKSTAYVPISDSFSWAANADNSVGLATVKKIADGKYYLAKTVDGGATWTEIYEQTNSGNAFRGFVWIAGAIWMWGDDDKIYLSTNDGTLASTTDVTGNAKTDFHTGGNHLEVSQIEFLQ